MANPYSVETANVLPGLGAAMSGIMQGAQAKQKRGLEDAKKAKQEQFASMFQTATPEEIASYVIKNPDMAESIKTAQDIQRTMTDEENAQQSWDVITGKVPPNEALLARAEEIHNRGGDASHTIALAQDAMQGGDQAIKGAYAYLAAHDPKGLEAYMKATGEGGQPASTTDLSRYADLIEQQFEIDNPGSKIPPKLKAAAMMKLKRATPDEVSQVAVSKLLAELRLKPEIVRGEAAARGEEQRASNLIARGVESAESTATIRRALNLLETVETGGINNASLAAKRFFGVEGADEGELSGALGKAVLSQLRDTFGAAFTQEEGNRLVRIEAGFGKSPETNKRLLRQSLRIAERTAKRARRAAKKRGDTSTVEDIDDLLSSSLSIDTSETDQLPQGVTEDDIQATMQVHGMTRQQVLDKLGAR